MKEKDFDVTDVELFFEKLRERTRNESLETLSKINIDKNFKNILKTKPTLKNLENILQFSFLMEDTRNIYDELIECLDDPKLFFQAVQLIDFLSVHSDFEYDRCNECVLELINNAESYCDMGLEDEKLLFFVIRYCESSQKRKEHQFIDAICSSLLNNGNLSSKRQSNQKILFSTITIMRIHPSSFLVLKQYPSLVSDQVNDYSREIANRMLLELKDKKLRPKKVFLKHFRFTTE